MPNIGIGLCTMITVGDNFIDMEDFGNYKHDWLKTFLELPNGVPSHDTFNRVISAIRFADKGLWKGLRSVGMVKSTRVIGDKKVQNVVYIFPP